MAPIGTIQLAGNANAGPAEVELNTLAARFVARPNDFQTLGSYFTTGQFSANSANTNWNFSFSTTLAPCFAFQWPVNSAIALIKKINVSMAGNSLAGIGTFALFKASQYYKQFDTIFLGTNGTVASQVTAAVPLSASKLRSSMADSIVSGETDSDLIPTYSSISANNTSYAPGAPILVAPDSFPVAGSDQGGKFGTQGASIFGGLQGGSMVLDANPTAETLASISSSSTPVFANSPLWDQRVAEHPLVLDAWTGFVVKFTSPIQAPKISITVHWDELTLF
jgi:hypothetical protein